MPLTENEILDLAIGGKIDDATARVGLQSVGRGEQIELVNGELRRIEAGQRFEQLPPPASVFGALASGVETGFKEIGAGALQVAGRAGEALGIAGAEDIQARAGRVVGQQRERFEAATAGQPVAGEIGRVGGQLAAFPVGGVTIPRAIVAGTTAGLLQPTEGPEGDTARAINALIGGASGGIFQAAIPAAINLIGRGMNKLGAVASSVFRSVTKKAPPPNAFDEAGNPTPAFIQAMQDAGISANDLDAMLRAVDSPNAPQIAEALGGGFERAAAEGLDPAAVARLAEFEALGVPATTAQVTRGFEAAQAEDVARGAIGETGVEARQFFAEQQRRLIGATEKFRKSIGAAPGASRQERGEAIKGAISGAKRENKEEVRALYDAAKELAGDTTLVKTADLEDVFLNAADELPIEENVLSSIERALAKFGVFEGDVARKGAKSTLTRPDGSTVTFKGDPEALTLANAEKLRQRLNAIFPNDRSGSVVALKNQLDTLVDDALDASLQGETGLAGKQAVEAARKGFAEFKRTFDAADIVGKITGVARDRTTPLIDDSVVIDKILRSQNKLENIQRIKSALGKSKNPQAEMAIKELQRGFVDDLFKKAISETPEGFVISGAKLNSAFERLGTDAMRELFPPALMAEFGTLRRVIGNATIPVPRTTNPSGSGGRILNAVIKISGLVEGIPGAGGVARFGLGALRRSIEKGNAEVAEEAALAGIRNARIDPKVTPKTLRDEGALARFLGLYAPRIARQAAITQRPNEVRK